jgi:predicted metal-dependent hydrolase
MITELLKINGITYPVKIHYETRNNCRVSVGKKSINIRIPSHLNHNERKNQVLKMKSWAENKIREKPEKFTPEVPRTYHNNEILNIGDEKYLIEITYKDKKSSSARLHDNIIKLSISNSLSKEQQNNHISSLISRCIGSKRLPKLQQKIMQLNKKYFNQKIGNIYFKNNKSNWGSCSSMGNINISTRLLFAPDDVLEYICIHELAHLIELNHSKKFWTLINAAMPDYKEKEKWLKNNGDICRF